MREIKFRYRFQHPEVKELILQAVLSIEDIERRRVVGVTPNPFEVGWIVLSRDAYVGVDAVDGRGIFEGDEVELRQETPKGSESLLTLTVKWSEEGLNYNIYPCGPEQYWRIIGNVYEKP